MRVKVYGLIAGMLFLIHPSISFAHTTVGNYERIDQNGLVTGWVFDPDNSSQSIDVTLLIDGPAGSGTTIAWVPANISRPDVNTAYNIIGNHGFTAQIPSQYRDGKSHTLYIYGIDTDPNTPNIQTSNSPATFSLAAASVEPKATVGNLESISSTGLVTGWVFDPNTPDQSIAVTLLLDGPAGSGTTIAWTSANVSRPDVDSSYHITGNHGFSIQIPAQYLDGKNHVLYVYGIDTDPGTPNIQTSNSPKTFSITTAQSAASCSLGGVTVVSGASATFYSGQSVVSPATCNSIAQTRSCTDGFLSGSAVYSYATCTVQSVPQTAPTKFYSGFPHYTDSSTGNVVYQITDDPGQNYALYYHQYYSTDQNSAIIVNIPPNDWRPIYYSINLYTGQKKVLSNQIANGELIKGNYFYGFNWAANPQYFGKENLITNAWTTLYQIPSGWAGTGSVTVNSDSTEALFSIVESGNSKHSKTYLLNLTTGATTLLREEPASDGHFDQHYVFSLVDPNVFTYVDQGTNYTAIGIPRIGLGTVSSGEMHPINLAADSGSYFDPAIFGGSNFAHPVWNADGRLCSDVLWHRQNPSGMYGFVCFKLGTDPFALIPQSAQELRFVSNAQWNFHWKDMNIPNWFVGDGGLTGGSTPPSLFTNIMHITSLKTGGTDVYKTDSYNLAKEQGPGEDHENAHLVANGQGVITTYDYAISGNATRNVFLIEVPTSVQALFKQTPSCVPNWSCTTWNACMSSGTQSRTCTDANNCGTSSGKPTESQSCSYSGSGGGGGGSAGGGSGGGSGSSGGSSGNSGTTQTNLVCPLLQRNLYRGLRGADVLTLQQFLISVGLLSNDSTTAYFGLLTQGAVQKWQTARGIVSYGSPAATGWGVVGPRTRAALLLCNK